MRLGSDVADAVEVLREEEKVHDVLVVGPLDALVEVDDGRAQPVDDGLPLLGHADAAEVLGLGLGLGPLDLEDLVPLGPLGDGELEALGGVDLIHGVLDAAVGVQVGDEGLQDLVAVLGHGGGEGLLDGERQVLLGLEDLV